MPANFEPNLIGLRAFLMADPKLREHLHHLGDKVLAEAQRLAPVGGQSDKHPGAYRDSLTVTEHLSNSRMSVRVGSNDQKAYWIEYGAKKMPKMAVLRRALDSVRGISKSASDYMGISEYDALNAGTQRKRQINRDYQAKKR